MTRIIHVDKFRLHGREKQKVGNRYNIKKKKAKRLLNSLKMRL
jgi:hypothetical protein